MKTFMRYFAAFVLAAAVVACAKNEPAGDPEIRLSQTEVALSSDGTLKKVVYELVNIGSDKEISVSYDADWLEVSTLKARLIEFSASKNESGAERSTDVIISCPGVQDVIIKVTQSIWNDPIVLTIIGTESTSVSFSVKTDTPELTWVGQVVGKDWFMDMESDEQIFQEDFSYYSLQAQDQGIPVSEYIATILNKGSFDKLQYKGLDPSSEYVVYVYGMTAEGVRTTDIYSAEAVTQPPYEGPITLTVDVTESDNIMDITVTPSHDGVRYYWNLMDKATYDGYAATHGACLLLLPFHRRAHSLQ